MGEEGCQEGATISDEIVDLKKLCNSNGLLLKQSVKTKSPEDLISSIFNLQNLSVEQLLKIAEAQSIESLLEKELEGKHRRELLERLLRQKKEMRELKQYLKSATNQCLFVYCNGTNVPVTSGEQSASNSSVISEVVDGNNMNDVSEAANVPDLPLSPELSPLAEEDPPLCGEGEGRNVISSLKKEGFVRELLCLPQDNCTDEELTSKLLGTFQDDILLRYLLRRKGLKISEFLLSQNELQKRQVSADNKPRRCQKLDCFLKTELCRRWTKYGYCPYGKSCQFAHGAIELRLRHANHKKCKTVCCKKFFSGYCPYGTSCCFVQDVSSRRVQVSCRPSNQLPERYQILNWMRNSGYECGDFAHRYFRCMDMSRRLGRQQMAYNPRQ